MNNEDLINIVLTAFEAERTHDVDKGLKLLSDDVKITEMSLGNNGDQLFASMNAAKVKEILPHVYQIKGREYEFVNVAVDSDKGVVMVEFVETYPDPKTGKIYRTPQVAVCELVGGRIRRNRHYNDPRVSYADVQQEDLDKAFS